MGFPAFFDLAPTITVTDPLADFLGAASDGALTYGYADVVRMAGHSCPTVAGAYLMVRAALRFLYGEARPERGGIEVFMRDPRDAGTTGVMASVATLLTGAATETGFGGIAGRFVRRGLLQYDAPIATVMALRRVDNGQGVLVDLDASVVPPAAEMRLLFPVVLGDAPDAAIQAKFGALWQERVAKMLIDHADDPALVPVQPWPAVA